VHVQGPDLSTPSSLFDQQVFPVGSQSVAFLMMEKSFSFCFTTQEDASSTARLWVCFIDFASNFLARTTVCTQAETVTVLRKRRGSNVLRFQPLLCACSSGRNTEQPFNILFAYGFFDPASS
jgi:hypothetical protein